MPLHKVTSLYPLLDLNTEPGVGKKQVMLPVNATASCVQYGNFVFLHVEYMAEQTRTCFREVYMVPTLQPVPSENQLIGAFVANETTAMLDDDDDDDEGEEMETTEGGVPLNPDEFYRLLMYVAVYITPEIPMDPKNSKTWSFLREVQ